MLLKKLIKNLFQASKFKFHDMHILRAKAARHLVLRHRCVATLFEKVTHVENSF